MQLDDLRLLQALPGLLALVACTSCLAVPCVEGSRAGTEYTMLIVSRFEPGGDFDFEAGVHPEVDSCGDLGVFATGTTATVTFGTPEYDRHCNGTTFLSADVSSHVGGATLGPEMQSLSIVSRWQTFGASRRDADSGGGCTGDLQVYFLARDLETRIDAAPQSGGPADFIVFRMFRPTDVVACGLADLVPDSYCGDAWVVAFSEP